MAFKRLIGLLLGLGILTTAQSYAQETFAPGARETSSQQNLYYFTTHGALNIERLLTDPAFEAAFAKLSPDEQKSLIETLDLFNEAFLQALIEAIVEL